MRNQTLSPAPPWEENGCNGAVDEEDEEEEVVDEE